MKDDDYEALYSLMSEMEWLDAAKFCRAETGLTLVESLRTAEWVAAYRPDTLLAQSWRNRE